MTDSNQCQPSELAMAEIGDASPAFTNHAVAACCQAWKRVKSEAIANGANDCEATRKAGEAYRAAMPALTTCENCRDFVACIAEGILLGVIPQIDAGRLLYAAQVGLPAVAAAEKAEAAAGYKVYASLSSEELYAVKEVMEQRRIEWRNRPKVSDS